MKEALFILGVLILLAALTAYRYRRQIWAVLEFMNQLKTIREGMKRPQDRIPEGPVSKGPLVNCQKCGSWVPEETAIKLGRTAIFCSAKCLETSKIAEHA